MRYPYILFDSKGNLILSNPQRALTEESVFFCLDEADTSLLRQYLKDTDGVTKLLIKRSDDQKPLLIYPYLNFSTRAFLGILLDERYDYTATLARDRLIDYVIYSAKDSTLPNVNDFSRKESIDYASTYERVTAMHERMKRLFLPVPHDRVLAERAFIRIQQIADFVGVRVKISGDYLSGSFDKGFDWELFTFMLLAILEFSADASKTRFAEVKIHSEYPFPRVSITTELLPDYKKFLKVYVKVLEFCRVLAENWGLPFNFSLESTSEISFGFVRAKDIKELRTPSIKRPAKVVTFYDLLEEEE